MTGRPQLSLDEVLAKVYGLMPAEIVPASSCGTWVLQNGDAAGTSLQQFPPSGPIVLGISCHYHDAAAAIVRHGEVIAAAEQERFSRRKHDSRFPIDAAFFCLQHAKLKINNVDVVAFYERPLLKFDRVLRCGRRWRDRSGALVHRQLAASLHERLALEEIVRVRLNYTGPVMFFDHHLSHAASAFFASPFDEAAILTVDGVGEWATTAEYIGSGQNIRPLREIHYPDSLGLLYSTLTAFLGFKVNNDEYKVMGLAGFGRPRMRDKVERLIRLFPDGSYRLNLEYFSFMFDDDRMFSHDLVELLGPPRVDGEPITPFHQDLAASLQAVLEDALIGMARTLYESAEQSRNLCLAGGVALNGVANWRLYADTPFEAVWVQPAAGDSGGAVGAALMASYAGGARREPRRFSAMLGPKFSNTEIEIVLRQEGVTYEWYLEEELLARTAELILKDRIIGWFQGRMEFGPRALGCRSILANACNPDMQNILNRRVKFREDFRPFAPAVLAENADEFFDVPFESPYMLFVNPVREDKRTVIPSVIHVDGTARVQTVARDDNPRFYRLLQEVERRCGVPVVINTSFNIRGEPIVCSPRDAVRCFLKTDIDFLMIGDFIVEKAV
jgi:carbamoyltransferase